MHKILCLNKISPIGTDRLGDNYEFSTEMQNPEGILVRSAAMHDMELPAELLGIARAGAGVNNIPLPKCSENGIVVFNTPGANANAVKELVLAALFMTSRKIIPAIDWAKTLKGNGKEVSKMVEKGKGAFAGPEIMGKKLGVIGLGAIGVLVANAAHRLGMQVCGYDPFLSVDAAWHLSSSVDKAASLDDIFTKCDYITVHVPLNDSTRGLIGADALAKMKNGVRILNFSRGELVDTAAILPMLENGKVAAYATDFPDDALIGVENVLAIPHLGASTPESEDNCAVMAVDQLKDYIENGNITNSVNFPAISMPRSEGHTRICIAHRNVPNTIGAFTAVCGEENINIENMLSKSRGDWAYTIVDASGEIAPDIAEKLQALDPVVRARVIY
ncbi:MAG: phosphoglycerate dehydrogenase [Clostridia bacterium]|nr:phosphoglycerate dehydrogenase [Clostridia bacterium]